jgi:predicted nucleic acid-binding protein
MYIDTSCLVAFYVPEKLTPRIDALITNADVVSISAITKIEFLSALNKKNRMGLFPPKESQIVFQEFKNHVSKGYYKLIEINSLHFRNASNLLLQTENALRSLDAIHLGIVQAESIPIATNDTILQNAATEFNVVTIEI